MSFPEDNPNATRPASTPASTTTKTPIFRPLVRNEEWQKRCAELFPDYKPPMMPVVQSPVQQPDHQPTTTKPEPAQPSATTTKARPEPSNVPSGQNPPSQESFAELSPGHKSTTPQSGPTALAATTTRPNVLIQDPAFKKPFHELSLERELTTTNPIAVHPYAENTFIGLPTELRLRIYRFALQDNIDSILITESPHSRSTFITTVLEFPLQPFLGGLALNHTNRAIRRESLDAFTPLWGAHQTAIRQHQDELEIARKQTPVLSERWNALEVDQTYTLFHCLAVFKLEARSEY